MSLFPKTAKNTAPFITENFQNFKANSGNEDILVAAGTLRIYFKLEFFIERKATEVILFL